MPKEILVEPDPGQEVVINPKGTNTIKSAKVSTSRAQARVIVSGTYVEPPPPVVTPPPTTEPPPTTTDPNRPVVPTGWAERFFLDGKDFKGVITGGSSANGYIYDNKMFMYGDTWRDTYSFGLRNSPGNLSVVDGVLRGHMFHDPTVNKGRGVHMIPIVPGCVGEGQGGFADFPIQRVAWRTRADLMAWGYWAHLLWPVDFKCGSTGGAEGEFCHPWPKWGECDLAEAALDGRDLNCFLHIQNGGSNGEGQIYTALGVKPQVWHNYVTEFSAGKYFKLWVDNVQKVNITDTTKVPAGPMHWVWQNEIISAPPAGASGYTDLKYLSVQTPA